MITMRLVAAASMAAALALSSPAWSASTTTTATPATTGPYAEGLEAVKAEDWQAAIDRFTAATVQAPDDADAWNMLAYSQRMTGDLEGAFANYQTALAIDPEHKDAHEYIGEAYLQVGDVAGAEKHLRALDEICWLGCSQEDELAAAIAAWKAENGG